MTHLSPDTLRAYQDGELPAATQAAAKTHLTECAACRTQLAEVDTRAAQVAAHLALLAPGPADQPRPAHQLFYQFTRKEREPMFKKLFARSLRPMWAGLAVVVALSIALCFPAVRTMASTFLGFFRVEKIRVVEFDPANLDRYSSYSGEKIEQIFSNNFTTTGGGEAQTVTNPAEAAQLAGFMPRLPTALSAEKTELSVTPASQSTFVVDRAVMQAVLDEMGRTDLRLPESIDGKNVIIAVPATVAAAYGDCATAPAYDPDEPVAEVSDCTTLAQLPSPTITTPPGLDLAELGTIMLEFLGMEQADAVRFSQTVDWSTTLVVPMPMTSYANYTEVAVDHTEGILVNNRYNAFESYTLLWVKDNRVYALMGSGTSAEALEIANSLQ